jgi:hypothetical protein
LRSWLGRRGAEDQPETQQIAAPPLALNLGIDFGTSFTKVAFRDLGTEETGIVAFDAGSSEGAMLPSIVDVSRTGDLALGVAEDKDSACTRIRYLKMRLADVALPNHPKTMTDPIPELGGIDYNSKEGVCALSSWFLATVIARAQQWVLHHEVARATGRTIQWSANIGVPVEYYDSPAITVFRQVLTVAWAWVRTNEIPRQIDTLVARYLETSQRTNPQTSDCHAVAEIAAAVQAFVTSRQAAPGIYVYFDIGGGTLDGVAFNFVNMWGERRINFYSGKVAPLGVEAVASRFRETHQNGVESVLMGRTSVSDRSELLLPIQNEIQRLVANVVMTAKKKDGRNWERDAVQDFRRRIGHLDPGRMAPLLVFIGGGGAGSAWYQNAIVSTHEEFGHGNAGVPPYELTRVATPSDVRMSGLAAAEFGRFAVSYGLSVPYGEGPEIGLPSEFSEVERAQAQRPTEIVDYLNSKEVYD